MPRHTHQDAVDEQTYQRLLDAADTLEQPFNHECRYILILGGRLGLRGGEIAHFRKGWIDHDRSMIQIPRHEPCTKGQGGGRCGYCHKRARSAVEHNDDLTMESALERRWEPKTANSARAVPYDFEGWIADAVDAFPLVFDEYPHSRVSVNRRVTRVAETAGLEPESVYPHALRATAATWHAYRGVPAPALQSLFGWSKLGTAMKYIRLSGGQTAQALRDVHQD